MKDKIILLNEII